MKVFSSVLIISLAIGAATCFPAAAVEEETSAGKRLGSIDTAAAQLSGTGVGGAQTCIPDGDCQQSTGEGNRARWGEEGTAPSIV